MPFFYKITNKYFTKKALPYWCILLLDCAIVVFAGYITSYLQLGGNGFAKEFWSITQGVAICTFINCIFFRLFHTYSGIIRHTSFRDLLHVLAATTCSSAVIALMVYLFNVFQINIAIVDLTYGILAYSIITLDMWLLRILVKAVYDATRFDPTHKRVFIYGVKEGALGIAKSLDNHGVGKYSLAGFISPDGAHDSKYIFGVQVRRDGPNIIEHMKKARASVLLVSPLQSQHFRKQEQLINQLLENNIKILMLPSAEEWDGKSDLSHNQLREVEIEDLLPRDKIDVDMDAIADMLRGKRILITGAAGSIGSEMARQVAKFSPDQLVLIDQAETPMHDVRLYMAKHHKDLKAWTIVGSITNQEHMETIFSEHKPEYVFHAAAYKHVPMMEDNPAMAVQNNIYGTRVIADLAVKYGTRKFVMISTDKAVNPTNVMGCSKRICEIYCQSLNKAIQDGTLKPETLNIKPETADGSLPFTQFITTRFGNVLGSNGSVIPIFKDQIKKGGPVLVTHPDIIRYFMLIPEACKLVLEAGTMGNGGEIFVFDMGEQVKIVDLAKRMIHLSGAKDIKIEFTGLRPGEKLYEEVLNDAEQTKPTLHPKIKIASVREYPYELALQNEIELHTLSHTYDDMAIVRKMKQIVPEYKSQESKYCILDK